MQPNSVNSPQPVSRQKLLPVLAEVRKFCVRLVAQLKDPSSGPFELPGRSVSSDDLGGFSLSDEEAREYSELLERLVKVMGGTISEKSLATAFDRAILKTLDPRQERQDVSPETRAADAVKEMETLLSATPVSWGNYIALLGVSPPKEPWHIGDVVIFDPAHEYGKEVFRHLDRINEAGLDHPSAKKSLRQQIRTTLEEAHRGQAFAEVQNYALDADAAWTSAKQRLQFVLDCLNFALKYEDRTHVPREISYAQPRRPFRTGLSIRREDFSSLQFHTERTDSGPIVQAEQFRQAIRDDPALARLLEWIASPVPSGHQARVLAAAHWAGRAAVAERAEESFLYNAIALESFILGIKGAAITMRLQLCTVHILGDWLKSRAKSVKDISDLYDKRSKIVHSGSYQIVPADLNLLVGYLMRVFARVLGEEPFINMQGAHDLDAWFDAALRGDEYDPTNG